LKSRGPTVSEEVGTLASRRRLYAVVAAALILLNLGTLATAIPETAIVDGGCCAPNQLLAKDFSAYYTAAWRLVHDPSQIYTRGTLADGAPAIKPQPQGYKYLPSFLFMVLPLLALPYSEALLAFDLIQFLLLPLVAILLYVLLKDKGLLVGSVAAVVVLLLPLPLLGSPWAISIGYFWQWAEGQSKVLETFLLLLSLALAKAGKPRLSGFTLGLAAFDPRFALLALPLLFAYSSNFRRTMVYAALTFGVTNAALLYPPMTGGFVSMLFATGLSTPPYYYSFIPIAALASLMVVDRRLLKAAAGLRGRGRDMLNSNP
jgi:Glycosyltransferase family 87